MARSTDGPRRARRGPYALDLAPSQGPGEYRSFSTAVILKAGRLAYGRPDRITLDGHTREACGSVIGSDGHTLYRVNTDMDPGGEIRNGGGWSWATCTCDHGANKGDSRCYHVAAIMLRALEVHRIEHERHDDDDDDYDAEDEDDE